MSRNVYPAGSSEQSSNSRPSIPDRNGFQPVRIYASRTRSSNVSSSRASTSTANSPTPEDTDFFTDDPVFSDSTATDRINSTYTETQRTEERLWPYDPITSTLDMRHLKSTDLPFNSFVHIPPALEENQEIKVQDLKRELIRATEDYLADNESRLRKTEENKKYPNLTAEESRGLDQLKKREDIVIYPTDKTGRFSVDSCDNYIEASLPHTQGDTVIDEPEHERLQKEINAHTAMWLRLSRAGEGTGNGKSEFQRIKNSSKVNHHGYAPLYTLRKDHKPIEDPLAGPPTRPVCGGSAAYNHKLSHILGYFLRPVWQESDTTCTSTEELLAAFEDVNQKQILDEDCEIGSLDVKALYPSLDVQFASKIVGKMFLDSKVVVPALDIRELGLYLALNKTPNELREIGLLKFCPTRRSRRGRPPNMTGCGTKEQLEERFKSFAEAQNKEPDEYTQKRMLAEAITIGVQFIMTNHVYMFNKVIRKQTKGGPIGLALTGDVAQVFMVWWDRELIGRARIQGLEFILYKRYVDDINNITRRIRNPGITLPPDKTNTTEVKQIANGIHKSISVTSDCPSEHEDEKIPILDVKAWLQRLQEENGNSQVFIMYEFYYKEVASRAVVNARSAIPIETMRTILTQEVLRILRNCSRRLPWKTISTHVENFCARMQYSGHGQTMRTQVVRSALSAYRKIIQKDLTGEVPMHRPRDWNKEERVKNKRKKKKGWFRGRKGQNETVIFIPVTPSSDLKKRYQKVIKKAGIKVAVVEVPGRSLKRRLQRSDPFKPDFCSKRDSCMVCESREGRGGGRCRIEGVTYSVNCSECDCVYVGETGRNAFSRGLEHRAAILKKDITSPLYSHSVDDHDGQSVTFNMHVTGSFGGDALKRQISEGVNIQETPAHFILNRRDEWRQTLLPRVQVCSTN